MKTIKLALCLSGTVLAVFLASCSRQDTTPASATPDATPPGAGQSAVADNESQKDVVKVAVGSPDHTTLVTAVQAAGLVDVLSNAGPFTVFAPTNAAFDKLPSGTVANLLKPASKDALINILEYHVAVAVFRPDMLKDGMTLEMVNGGKVTFTQKDGKIMLNGTATVLGSVTASNGIVHVIDAVLLPPAAK